MLNTESSCPASLTSQKCVARWSAQTIDKKQWPKFK